MFIISFKILNNNCLFNKRILVLLDLSQERMHLSRQVYIKLSPSGEENTQVSTSSFFNVCVVSSYNTDYKTQAFSTFSEEVMQ